MNLPEVIVRYILDFNYNCDNIYKITNTKDYLEFNLEHKPNLLKCHAEIMENRPYYFKKVVAGFSPGISDDPTWHNFKRNDIITIYSSQGSEYKLKLYAIEITPKRLTNTVHWHDRDIHLYYGWVKRINDAYLSYYQKYFSDEFEPGQY